MKKQLFRLCWIYSFIGKGCICPEPDAIDQIKSQGFHLYANTQPHLWPWQFSFEKGSPWQDIRVRK
ncbi:hypothetical protein GJD58_27990, partial [Klebsiella pneumoniae]|nr:hypothetical protein [Klebsiella pneumoniae]